MKQLQHNRVLALVLCAVLVLSQAGPAALAADDGVAAGESRGTCTCDAPCTEDSVSKICPVCGTEGAYVSLCTGGQSHVALDVTSTPTPTPTSTPTPTPTPTPTSEPPAASSVPYLDENRNQQTSPDATPVTDSNAVWQGEPGWYVVNGTVTVAQRITVTGQVHLILADDAKLNAEQGINVSKGINVSEGNSLTIYAQSTGETAGALTAVGSSNDAGNGGKVTATSSSRSNGAGIGGGQGGDGGTITINGGNVTAEGEHGAGIGGGQGGDSGTITINGGNVTAVGEHGAGIGAGRPGNVGPITIRGGTVTATSTYVGIGYPQSTVSGAAITISGGTVTATGDKMGIGGSAAEGVTVTITISGGIVTASGGIVTASGGNDGIGIGSESGDSDITISGGTVTARGGNVGIGSVSSDSKITISGGTVTASGDKGGIGSWTAGDASAPESTFTTAGEGGTPGNAFLVTNSIQNQDGKDNWSGVVIEDNTGAVYGGRVTLTTDATLPSSARLDIPGGTTLTVAKNVTLTVADGAKLTVEGAIFIKNGGALIGNVDIINNGSITNEPPPWVPDYDSDDDYDYDYDYDDDDDDDDDVPTPTPAPTVPPVDPTRPELPTNVQTKVDSTVNEDGTATVEIPDQTITDAIGTAKDQGGQGGISITIQAAGTETADSVAATLSARALSALAEAGVNALTIECAPLTVTLDLGTLKTLLAAGGEVALSALRQENAQLSAEARVAVGHRPVYQLTATAGGTALTQFGGQISVAIPYTPAANEVPDSLCAVYVDDGGQVEWLEHSGYDRDAGAIQFTTDHFSAFGIGYRAAVTFADVEGHWAEEEIAFVVAEGLLNGTSDTTFHPDLSMTRGMFVTALGRLAQADVSAYQQSRFTDVAPGSYYLGYVQWASDNGIVNGIGDGAFAPDRPITREQMAVIMSHYAGAMALPVPGVHGESAFADGGSISAYAVDAVRQMQMAGILAGKGGNVFDPQGTATRAEASAVLQRFAALTGSDA